MKKRKLVIGIMVLCLAVSATAGANLLDKAKAYIGKEKQKQSGAKDEKTVAAGLKEALEVGSRKAVEKVSKKNGYLGNPKIRIPLPDKVKRAERTLRRVGLGKKVDEFEVTMNRAAEKAAPVAKDIFIDAVKKMTITDAIKILRGNDTAATDYFRSKTYNRLYAAFKPPVSRTVREVGVTRSYDDLVHKAKRLHILRDSSLDLDHHITTKALDGLFYMLGQEEKDIRKNPAARVTELLRKVFGK